MPTLAPVVLIDRASTPKNHTFAPRSVEGGVGVVAEGTANGTAVGENQLVISTTRNATRRKAKLLFTFRKTANETVGGVDRPVILDSSYVTVEATFGNLLTEAERNDIMGQVQSSLAASQTLIHGVVVKGESVYS